MQSAKSSKIDPGWFNKRQQYEILWGQLDLERSTFMAHWRDLGDYILPRRPRFTITDVNRGERRSQNIIDSSATLAVRTLRSGMMSGITSPARPWFRLTTPDPDMAENGPVKDWLYIVTQRMANTFIKSNLYNSLPIIYGDMGVFATGSVFIEEDVGPQVFRTYPQAVGSYWIANDELGKVNTWIRDFQMTVRQIVEKFGVIPNTNDIDWTNISTQVKSLWDVSAYQTKIFVRQVIHPNDNYDPRKLHSKYKKFTSCYYERGSEGANGNEWYANQEPGKLLRESGYDYFPVLCPRWEVTGEDSWGTSCPGMEALGDIRQLQLGERRGMQAIEKMVNPPMTGPTSLRNSKTSILPGDVTFVDTRDNSNGFKPAHEVQFRLQELENKQEQVRHRISRAFYEDLFLMMAQSDRREITAREIDERHEEKLLALGPVLEQLNQDLLNPLIDITFNFMAHQNLIPPPPEELQGMDLKVEYISTMAQAQKMVGSNAITSYLGVIGQIAQFHPDVVDKVDSDQTADILGDIMSVPPGIVRTDDQVAQIRQAKAKQQAQAEKAQQMQQMSGAAKNLAQAPTDGDNALTRLMQTQGQQQPGQGGPPPGALNSSPGPGAVGQPGQ